MLGHVCGIPFGGHQLGGDAMDDIGDPHVDKVCWPSLNVAFDL
jgi:hypothetical protein